jgi:hypothetical protein
MGDRRRRSLLSKLDGYIDASHQDDTDRVCAIRSVEHWLTRDYAKAGVDSSRPCPPRITGNPPHGRRPIRPPVGAPLTLGAAVRP